MGIIRLLAKITGTLMPVVAVLPPNVPAPEITVEVTSARIARGQYLATAALGCRYCHSERDWTDGEIYRAVIAGHGNHHRLRAVTACGGRKVWSGGKTLQQPRVADSGTAFATPFRTSTNTAGRHALLRSSPPPAIPPWQSRTFRGGYRMSQRHVRGALALLGWLLAAVAASSSAEPASPAAIERLDARLDALLDRHVRIEVLARNVEWAEGPLWSDARNALLFSGVPRNAIDAVRPGSPPSVVVSRSGYTGSTPFAGPGGVHIFDADGTRLGRIVTAVKTGNLAFCEDGATLFIAAEHQILRLRTRLPAIASARSFR